MTAISFSELCAPVGELTFLNAFAHKRFLYFDRPPSPRFEPLFSWQAVNSWLSQNLLDEKRLRIARDGMDVPPVLYRREKKDRNPVDSAKVSSLLNQGSSLVINRVQDLSPPVRRLARQVETKLSQTLNVNGYLTFGTGGAFGVHFDPHDVLVLQVHGSKRWFLYDQPEIDPLIEDKKNSSKPLPRNVIFEAVLQPGTILYVPRGVYHRAAVAGDYSTHLTFGIHTKKGVDFLEWLQKKIARDPLFKQDLFVQDVPTSLVEQQERLKSRLIEVVQSSSVVQFLNESQKAKTRIDHFQLGPVIQLDDDVLLAPLIRNMNEIADYDWVRSPKRRFDVKAIAVLRTLLEREFLTAHTLRELYHNSDEDSDFLEVVRFLVMERLVEAISGHREK